MIKRIPMIMFVLTILSLLYMIVVRLDAMGTRLLTKSSGAGKFIASSYNFSVILFLVISGLFVLTVFISLRVQSSRRHAPAAVHKDETAEDE